MTSESTQDVRYFHKTTKQTYRVVWKANRAVLLESDDSIQVLTSTSALYVYYEPLVTAHRRKLRPDST